MRVPSLVAMTIALVAAAEDDVSSQGTTALPPYAQSLMAQLPPDADKVVSVLGCVQKPRTTITPAEGLTVSKAVDIAGGFSDFAIQNKVGVWRSRESRYFIVDVKAVLAKKTDAQDPPLNAGDVVFINSRVDRFKLQ